MQFFQTNILIDQQLHYSLLPVRFPYLKSLCYVLF